MEDIHDIKGLIEILPFWREHLILILIICSLLCIAIVLLLYLKRAHKNNNLDGSNPRRLTPYEQAIHDLMNAQEFMKPGFDKVLSTMTSDIIRQYLEQAFKLQASEKTTEEFLHNVQKDQVFHGKPLEILASFLEMCDFAKFAKFEFTHSEQKLLLEKAHAFLGIAHKEELRIIEEAKKREGIQTE